MAKIDDLESASKSEPAFYPFSTGKYFRPAVYFVNMLNGEGLRGPTIFLRCSGNPSQSKDATWLNSREYNGTSIGEKNVKICHWFFFL